MQPKRPFFMGHHGDLRCQSFTVRQSTSCRGVGRIHDFGLQRLVADDDCGGVLSVYQRLAHRNSSSANALADLRAGSAVASIL